MPSTLEMYEGDILYSFAHTEPATGPNILHIHVF